MVEDASEHRGVAVFRQRLETLFAKAVVSIGPHGDAPADTRVELTRITPPLFARVVLEEHLVEPASDLAHDHLLAVARRFDGLAPLGERRGHLLRRTRVTDELLESVEVDRKLPVAAVGPGEHLVFDGVPRGELAEVGD